jgi:hypothetical protein
MRIATILGIATLGLALGSGCAEQPGKKKDDEKSKDGKDAKKSKGGKSDEKGAEKAEAKVDPPK